MNFIKFVDKGQREDFAKLSGVLANVPGIFAAWVMLCEEKAQKYSEKNPMPEGFEAIFDACVVQRRESLFETSVLLAAYKSLHPKSDVQTLPTFLQELVTEDDDIPVAEAASSLGSYDTISKIPLGTSVGTPVEDPDDGKYLGSSSDTDSDSDVE